MIRFVFLLLVLTGGLFIGSHYSAQQGYVLISIANSTIEMSVTTLVILIVVGLGVLFSLEFLIRKCFQLGSNTFTWLSVRKKRRARQDTNQALIRFFNGDFKTAEKLSARFARYHETPLIPYLIAAQSALERQEHDLACNYFDKAKSEENSALPIALLRAQYQIKAKLFDKALSALNEVKINHGNNPKLLSLLKTTYIELGQWKQLLDILPILEKSALIKSSEKESLYALAFEHRLKHEAKNLNAELMLDEWQKLPNTFQQNDQLLHVMVSILQTKKANAQLFELIKQKSKKFSHPSLYQYLADLPKNQLDGAIKLLNKGLKQDPSSKEAHSALGLIYMKQANWEMAEKHLSAAIKITPDIKDELALAETLTHLNKYKQSQDIKQQVLTTIGTDKR